MESDPKTRRHKAMGIASCLMAPVAVVALFGAGLLALQFEDTGSETVETDKLIAVVLWFALLANLVGIGLGVAGVFDKTSKKVFPILGITLGMAPWVRAGAYLVIQRWAMA